MVLAIFTFLFFSVNVCNYANFEV